MKVNDVVSYVLGTGKNALHGIGLIVDKCIPGLVWITTVNSLGHTAYWGIKKSRLTVIGKL